MFRLTVPGTDTPLVEDDGRLTADGDSFGVVVDGIWDLVRDERRPILDCFAAKYAAVRAKEHRELSPAEVQALPNVDSSHPLATMWQQRAASYERFKTAISATAPGLAIDIGAGSGWLAADLARSGWHAAAVDVTVHGGDGLAAARHHDAHLLLIRAEMQVLPFATNSVDLAVFNASLHYAENVIDALHEAARVVRPGGSLAVLDSPVFRDPAAGHTMVEEFAAYSRTTLGVPAADLEGPGFVAESDLGEFPFDRSGDPAGWRDRVHQWRGARKAGRETAASPLLIATIGEVS